jgi:hypothetical protein
MTAPPDDPHAFYFHVRIMMGMVVGLALTHLLRGIARLIEHPARRPVYWIHLAWVLSMFIYIVHFWWWELSLTAEPNWTFGIYVFLVLYTLLLYLLAALLFPEDLADYAGYRDYFYSRRVWFFSVLAFVYVVDFYDSWLKGTEYFHSLGPEYLARNIGYIALCSIAIATRNPWFHGAFVVAGAIYQVSWIVRLYEVVR